MKIDLNKGFVMFKKLVFLWLLLGASTSYAQSCQSLAPNKINADGEVNFIAEIIGKNPDKINRINAMIKCNANLEMKSAMTGTYPIQAAAGEAEIEVVEILIKNGADVNTKSQLTEYTALHMAAQRGEEGIPIIKLLLKHGANKSAKEVIERTPFDVAKTFTDSKEVLDLLRP